MRAGFPALTLEYPMSLGTFDTYPAAQKAVDTLSDAEFPVQNCLIVGTDLKQLERVTGRLTWGRVTLAGLMSGLWLGLFVGLVFAMFGQRQDALSLMVFTALAGAVFGMVWSMLGYAFTRGARDFTSVSQTVATKYEVLVEHKHAQAARDILVKAALIPGYVVPPVPSTPPAPSAPPSSSQVG